MDDPDRPQAVVITGPLMRAEHRAEIERLSQDLPAQVIPSVNECLSYLNAADLVVTMGGYNSLLETMQLDKNTLVIPRKGPSAEQTMRATALAERGLARMVEIDQASPDRLAAEIKDALGRPLTSARGDSWARRDFWARRETLSAGNRVTAQIRRALSEPAAETGAPLPALQLGAA